MRHQPQNPFWRRTLDRLPTLSSIRPVWLIAAAALAIVLAPAGYSTSGDDTGYAIWSVFVGLASLLAAMGIYPWVAGVYRRYKEQGHSGRTLGGYVAFWTLVPVLLPLGFPAWVGIRWDESDLPLQPLAQATASVFTSFMVVALLGVALAMFGAMIADFRRGPWT